MDPYSWKLLVHNRKIISLQHHWAVILPHQQFNQVSASFKLFKASKMYNYSIDNFGKDLHELTKVWMSPYD